MSKHARAAALSFLAAASVLLGGTPTATADPGLPDAAKAGFAESFIGWIAVTLLQTTSRSGPRAKMLDGASPSRRLAG